MKIAIRTSAPTERALLGCVIAHPELRHTLELSREDFYDQRHGVIWGATDGTLDLAGLLAILDARKLVDAAGGYTYISSLVDGLSNPGQAPVLAQQVRELAAIRRAQRSALDLVTNPSLELAQAADLASTAMASLQGAVHGPGSVRAGDALAREVRRMRDITEGKLAPPQVFTGFSRLDAALGGFRPWQFIILAARPKVGKSAMALQIARNAAGKGKGVLFMSLEMATGELACRLLAAEIGGLSVTKLINATLVRRGTWDDTDELEYVEQAEAKLRDLPLWIEFGMVSLDTVRVRAKTHRAQGRLDLVIVDYLGLMTPPPGNSIYAQVSALSKGVKRLAGELELPILAVHQLNRNIEHTETKRLPKLSDLRDSGSLEQDADVVIFLDRDLVTEDAEQQAKTTVVVAANRSGPTDKHEIRYMGKFTKFAEVA